MKLSKIKKLCAVALAVSLSASIFVGCGSESSSDAAADQKITYNLASEIETIDPSLNTATNGSTIISNAFEGLTRENDKGETVPGVAEKWEISDDKLTYTFHLRKDAKWSDGKPVTAKDFEYSWKRALDKKTGAEYAYQLFYIKNAEAFYNGKANAEDLGINVIDDNTIEVKLENSTPYFLELVTFPTYMPLRQDVIEAEGDKWTLKPESYISNGPFKLSDYAMKDKYVFVKNDNYWDKDRIKLNEITMKMVLDKTTSFASLESGEFDMIDDVPTERIEDGKQKGLIQTFPNLGTYFLCFNLNNNQDKLNADVRKAINNKDVRRALSLAINRVDIVENVTKTGQVPSASITPAGIKDPSGKDFKKNAFDPTKQDENVAEAKKLLEKAGYKDGKGLPKLKLMYNTEGEHKKVMEVVQQNWKTIGVECELVNQEWPVFLNSRQDGDFEVARHGWVADYVDPMTFLDMWVSGQPGEQATWGNNNSHFSNKEFDELISKAKKESDENKRFEYLRKAEDIMLEETATIPIYDYTKTYGIQTNLKGVRGSLLGYALFDNAYEEEK